jgi:3-phenylpropionate/trans-cinnamate dioxygenase ferredoxin subunit
VTAHRTDPDTGANRWSAQLGPAEDLPAEGQSRVFETHGRRIAIFNVEGDLYAIDDTCTHRPASLSEDGDLDDGVLVCGWHGSMFDLATGKNVGPPACDPLRTYDLEITDSVVARERG